MGLMNTVGFLREETHGLLRSHSAFIRVQYVMLMLRALRLEVMKI